MSEDDDQTRILRVAPGGDAPTRVLPGHRGAPADVEEDDPQQTRVLARRQRAPGKPGGVVAPPGDPGDRIVFQCPNGHRIVVGKQFAGKRGKCNKCGADVHIPLPSGAAPTSALPGMSGPPSDDEPEADEANEPSAEDDEAPSLDALAFGDLAPQADMGADGFGGLGVDGTGDDQAENNAADWNFAAEAVPSPAVSHGWTAPGGAPSFDADDGNPTAQLVARLWGEREHGGIVELHLEGGAVLLPEWYESKWSKGTHGLFASQAPDGSVTLTAVAWESVQKVVVRQLAAVPDDMFT